VQYVGNVIRPPSEANSLIIQITTGCSHNLCTFCGAYPQRFTVKPLEQVREDLKWCQEQYGSGVRRLFLADGNAMVCKFDNLLSILEMAHESFPKLRRVGSYANARDVASKTDAELLALAKAGLSIAYVGLESGDEELLKKVDKGATAREIIEAVQRLERAGIRTSVMVLLGLAGADPDASLRHARATALACNAMQPRFLSLLTVMIVPKTPMEADLRDGRFTLPDTQELLRELECILTELELRGTIFRSNHASNYLPLAGNLPKDKGRMLDEVASARRGERPLIPEFLRGL